jgi:hypothetical protein
MSLDSATRLLCVFIVEYSKMDRRAVKWSEQIFSKVFEELFRNRLCRDKRLLVENRKLFFRKLLNLCYTKKQSGNNKIV